MMKTAIMPHATSTSFNAQKLAILAPKPDTINPYDPHMTTDISALDPFTQMQIAMAYQQASGQTIGDANASVGASAYGPPQYLWYDSNGANTDATAAAYYQAAASQYMYPPVMTPGMSTPHGVIPGQQTNGDPSSSSSYVAEPNMPAKQAAPKGRSGAKPSIRQAHHKRLRIQTRQEEQMGQALNYSKTKASPTSAKSARNVNGKRRISSDDEISKEQRAAIKLNIQKRIKLRMLVKGKMSAEDANLSPDDIQTISTQIPNVVVHIAHVEPTVNQDYSHGQQHEQHQQQVMEYPTQLYNQATGTLSYGTPYDYQYMYGYDGMPLPYVPMGMQLGADQTQVATEPAYIPPQQPAEIEHQSAEELLNHLQAQFLQQPEEVEYQPAEQILNQLQAQFLQQPEQVKQQEPEQTGAPTPLELNNALPLTLPAMPTDTSANHTPLQQLGKAQCEQQALGSPTTQLQDQQQAGLAECGQRTAESLVNGQEADSLMSFYNTTTENDRRFSWTLPMPDLRRFSFSSLSFFSPNDIFSPSGFLGELENGRDIEGNLGEVA